MATVVKRTWTDTLGRTRDAWRVSYNDQSGKRRHKQFRKKKDADAFAITAQWEVRQGIHTVDADSVTVKAAAEIWLASTAASGCDRGTLKSYREVVIGHIVPQLGSDKLSRLTAPKVVAFRDGLLGSGRSHAMTSKAVRHLSMILIEAQNRGLVAQNVARTVKVRRPREDGKRARIARRAEIPPTEHLRALVAAADRLELEDPRLPVLVRVVMLAGLRQSEVRGFRWANADLRVPALTVCERADRWCVNGFTKSDDSVRTIPIGPDLARRMRSWKLRCPPSDLGLMFPNARGKILDQKGVMALFLRVQIEAALAIDSGRRDRKNRTIWMPRYGLHDLRHAAASAWIAQGVDLKRLQVWIGHANIQLTLDVYGHLVRDADRDSALATAAEAIYA
jgi:integrase